MGNSVAMGAATGVTMLSAFTVSIAAIVMWVLYIIAFWKVYTKMGEPGWKCIIPIYNWYILYKRTWKTSMFWASLALGFIGVIVAAMGANVNARGDIIGVADPTMVGVGMLMLTIAAIIEIVQVYNFSKSFGHGFGYFIGLIVFYYIFVLVIGFGSSRYIGPKGGSNQQKYQY